MLVVVLVVVLLVCCCFCVGNAAATVVSTLPLLLLLIGVEDDACYMNADSSPATLAHTIFRVLNRAFFNRPLPDGCAGGMLDWYGPLLPLQAAARQQQGWRVSEGRGNKEGYSDGNKGGKQ